MDLVVCKYAFMLTLSIGLTVSCIELRTTWNSDDLPDDVDRGVVRSITFSFTLFLLITACSSVIIHDSNCLVLFCVIETVYMTFLVIGNQYSAFAMLINFIAALLLWTELDSEAEMTLAAENQKKAIRF